MCPQRPGTHFRGDTRELRPRVGEVAHAPVFDAATQAVGGRGEALPAGTCRLPRQVDSEATKVSAAARRRRRHSETPAQTGPAGSGGREAGSSHGRAQPSSTAPRRSSRETPRGLQPKGPLDTQTLRVYAQKPLRERPLKGRELASLLKVRTPALASTPR